MQATLRFSLNAARVFTVAARHGTISGAAAELGVTPSAVSHQIKNLEIVIGVSLFLRGNNSIRLTDAGRRFHEDASAAIAMIDRSAAALRRGEDEIVVRVSVSLAVRWLIPALERFKRLHPDVRVRVETTHLSDESLGQSTDVAITYRRIGDDPAQGALLLRDLSRPVLSPVLFAASSYRGPQDIGNIPAIKCTADNWDWRLWAKEMNIAAHKIMIVDEFDTDDAALHAAVAGLGMVLAPALMTAVEIDSGALIELPGFQPVEVGRYILISGQRQVRAVRRFCDWLRAEMADASAD